MDDDTSPLAPGEPPRLSRWWLLAGAVLAAAAAYVLFVLAPNSDFMTTSVSVPVIVR